jgi:catechol 2,3-dioxygenase-like lactoylglutathione lyase family enzyme
MPSPYRLDHIAIHARDFDASVRFYAELLGLPEVENPMGSGWIRWFEIAPGTNLHLVPGNQEPLPERAIGTHLALPAPDFDALVARLTAAGVAFGDLPNRPGKITTRPDGVRQCFIHDPDNTWIEINDAPPR